MKLLLSLLLLAGCANTETVSKTDFDALQSDVYKLKAVVVNNTQIINNNARAGAAQACLTRVNLCVTGVLVRSMGVEVSYKGDQKDAVEACMGAGNKCLEEAAKLK